MRKLSLKSWMGGLSLVLLSFPVQAGNTLNFQAGVFDTTYPEQIQEHEVFSTVEKTEYSIVQFESAITAEDRNFIKALELSSYGYIPDDALIVRLSPGQKNVLAARRTVKLILPYTATLKLSPELNPRDHLTAHMIDRIAVRLFDSKDQAQVLKQIQERRLGAVKYVSERFLGLEIPRDSINELAKIEGIEWVENYPEFSTLQDPMAGNLDKVSRHDMGEISELTGIESGTEIMNFESAWQRGATGKGQLVGFSDTGLDSGSLASLHNDFQGQVLKGYAYGLFGFSWADPMGHGTHVAGSVAGSGAASQGLLKGGAYEAQLIAGGMWSALGTMIPPSDITKMFADAFSDGARVHTNSWGSAQNLGNYDQFALDVDQFIWDNPDMLILFAAGNSGTDSDKNGRIDEDSIGSPATAKNVLSVGASENVVTKGGLQRRVGDLKDQQGNILFPTEPLASDMISDSADGVAFFSSRGPTDDRRIKPDLVAPGVNILSVRSQHKDAGELWGAFNQDYVWSGGTSMSTPLVAGAAAVLRHYLKDSLNISNPSAAMVKGLLMHTSTDLFPGQFGEIGKSMGQEVSDRRPGSNQGFGRVNMDRATQLQDDFIFDEKVGVGLNEVVEFAIGEVQEKTIMVTLTYTDYPGTVSSSKTLVNDLDLVIKVDGQEVAQGADRVNNWEYIKLNDVTGDVTLEVRGTNIPQPRANQKMPFAVVVSAN